MIVQLNESVYDVTVDIFNKIIEMVVEKNSARYFIYCVCIKDSYMLVNDSFDDKSEFLELLLSYIEKGFDVYFIEEGVRCVERCN